GALCAVLRVEGSILDDSARALLDFTARLHFYAGSSQVRLDFTVENNQPVLETGDGQPANAHSQGAINSVYIGSLTLNLRLRDTGDFRVRTENAVEMNAPASAVRLYQDSSGTGTWNNYVGDVGWPGEEASAAPRLQSYCAFGGYQITGPGLAEPVAGDQALGWASASFGAAGPRLTAAVRDFWQNFPKAIEVAPDGTVSVDLFPNGDQFRHNFRVGEEKTHSILLDFGLGSVTAEAAEQEALAFTHPMLGLARPSWYVKSGVLGEVPRQNVSRWPLYERYVNIAFEPNPDFDPEIDDPSFGNRTLEEIIDTYGFYGWQDYGDVPLDYEAFGPSQAGQMNLKYWYTYGMYLQLLRSGEARWLTLARPAAWHLADVDYLHIPDEGIQHWSHGAYFGHSQHDEPGNTNPNRNYNSPSVDLFFGVPDLLLAYYVTGERRFLDTANEGLEAMLNLSQFSDFENPVPYRERANLIFGYIEGYRQTGDARWMTALRTIVGETAETSSKPWIENPLTYRPGGDEQRLSSFAFSQVLWTLGKYLDFCEEYGLPDDLGVADALVVFGDFIIDHDMTVYTPGRAAAQSSFWFFDPGWEVYLEINNWALTTADSLAYAYKYSGEARFMDAAAMFYATGTIDPQWEDDAPVYLDTKGLVNALNWGLVYMNQLAE
ncbi:MAG TPA: hypothetical protein PK468_14370, partial [Candidatus Hydrogenedentes bacterium]|nr:hypothetical protein [Candidatus Hydrogenedentota bacterium]